MDQARTDGAALADGRDRPGAHRRQLVWPEHGDLQTVRGGDRLGPVRHLFRVQYAGRFRHQVARQGDGIGDCPAAGHGGGIAAITNEGERFDRGGIRGLPPGPVVLGEPVGRQQSPFDGGGERPSGVDSFAGWRQRRDHLGRAGIARRRGGGAPRLPDRFRGQAVTGAKPCENYSPSRRSAQSGQGKHPPLAAGEPGFFGQTSQFAAQGNVHR